MKKIVIGVDPHKLSVTIEVVDRHEQVLATGRFRTDKAGYVAMRKHVDAWQERTWAVEGSNGAGRPLAQRLLADGEHVVDVPAKLAARVRMLDSGHGRKTDAHDANSVAVAAVRGDEKVTRPGRELTLPSRCPPAGPPPHRRRVTRGSMPIPTRAESCASSPLRGDSCPPNACHPAGTPAPALREVHCGNDY